MTNSFLIEDVPGFTPQIGRLVGMMKYVRATTLQAVRGMTPAQLDYVQDDKATASERSWRMLLPLNSHIR